jgi:hypothetical protein
MWSRPWTTPRSTLLSHLGRPPCQEGLKRRDPREDQARAQEAATRGCPERPRSLGTFSEISGIPMHGGLPRVSPDVQPSGPEGPVQLPRLGDGQVHPFPLFFPLPSDLPTHHPLWRLIFWFPQGGSALHPLPGSPCTPLTSNQLKAWENGDVNGEGFVPPLLRSSVALFFWVHPSLKT